MSSGISRGGAALDLPLRRADPGALRQARFDDPAGYRSSTTSRCGAAIGSSSTTPARRSRSSGWRPSPRGSATSSTPRRLRGQPQAEHDPPLAARRSPRFSYEAPVLRSCPRKRRLIQERSADALGRRRPMPRISRGPEQISLTDQQARIAHAIVREFPRPRMSRNDPSCPIADRRQPTGRGQGLLSELVDGDEFFCTTW